MRLSTVLFPAPFGPMMLVMSPGRASKQRLFTARTPPKFTERSLAKQKNNQGSHQRAEEPVGAANHHHEQKQDRLKERKGFRADEVGHRREHAAGEAGGDRRNRECGGSDQRRIKPNRLTRNFGVANRAHGFAPWAGAQPGVEVKPQNREAEHEERHLALREVKTKQSRQWNTQKSVPSAGQAVPLGGALLHHEAERDCHHGEVGSAYAQRRDSQQDPGSTGNDSRQGQRGPKCPIELGRKDANHISTNRVEGGMAERNLAGHAEQDVESHAHDRGQSDQRDDVEFVAIGSENEHTNAGKNRGNSEGSAEVHTFLTSACPNSPVGLIASARITRANVAIWLYVDPASAMMSASAIP